MPRTVCDACGNEAPPQVGRASLIQGGWKIHHVRSGEPFVLCADCVEEYAARRAMTAALNGSAN